MIKILIELVLCHLIGDYVFQVDFIANTKGTNWYHLFVHCALYMVPFIYIFGFSNYSFLLFVFITHTIIDALKATYKKINYVTDQILHYMVLIIGYRYLLH